MWSIKKQQNEQQRRLEIKGASFFTDSSRFHNWFDSQICTLLQSFCSWSQSIDTTCSTSTWFGASTRFAQSILLVSPASPLPGHRGEQECVRCGAEGPGASDHSSLRPLHARDRPLHDRVHESGALRLWMAGLVTHHQFYYDLKMLFIVTISMQWVDQSSSLTFDLSPVDGLMTYSIPDGHQMIYRGLDVYFNDSVYDGASAERSEFHCYLWKERCRP